MENVGELGLVRSQEPLMQLRKHRHHALFAIDEHELIDGLMSQVKHHTVPAAVVAAGVSSASTRASSSMAVAATESDHSGSVTQPPNAKLANHAITIERINIDTLL